MTMEKEVDAMCKKRKMNTESENSNDSLDFTVVENLQLSNIVTANLVKQEISVDQKPSTSCRDSSTPVLENEAFERRQSYDLGPADGVVKCGQCQQNRATLCCMEPACVSFAYRTWNMTSLFICDDCDLILHDGNPIMAEHQRTRLIIRSSHVESMKQLVYREPVPVLIHENQNPAVSLFLQSSLVEPERNYVASKHATSHPKLSGRNLSLTVMLERVHERYQSVLHHNLARHCPLTETFRETKVPRQTLVDAIAIAELKIVDPARYDEVMASYKDDKMAPRMFDVETTCRIIMREYTDTINRLRGKTLIPFRFNVYVSKK